MNTKGENVRAVLHEVKQNLDIKKKITTKGLFFISLSLLKHMNTRTFREKNFIITNLTNISGQKRRTQNPGEALCRSRPEEGFKIICPILQVGNEELKIKQKQETKYFRKQKIRVTYPGCDGVRSVAIIRAFDSRPEPDTLGVVTVGFGGR